MLYLKGLNRSTGLISGSPQIILRINNVRTMCF